ncbi:hypothetical protein FPQ18DRAFT_377699 [Pyronema domesticum]|nr:hypothetical protein FPQ18DRAFT_377699 [Pyronema domesticum]
MAALNNCHSDHSGSTLSNTATAGIVAATCLNTENPKHHSKVRSVEFPSERYQQDPPWSPLGFNNDKRRSQLKRVIDTVSSEFSCNSALVPYTPAESISQSPSSNHEQITYVPRDMPQSLHISITETQLSEDDTITQQNLLNRDFAEYESGQSPSSSAGYGVFCPTSYGRREHQTIGGYSQDGTVGYQAVGATTGGDIICPAFAKVNTKNSPDKFLPGCRGPFLTKEEAKRHITEVHLKIFPDAEDSSVELDNLKRNVQNSQYEAFDDFLLFRPNRDGKRRKRYDEQDGTNCLPENASYTLTAEWEEPSELGGRRGRVNQRHIIEASSAFGGQGTTTEMLNNKLDKLMQMNQAIYALASSKQRQNKKRGATCLCENSESNDTAPRNKRANHGSLVLDAARPRTIAPMPAMVDNTPMDYSQSMYGSSMAAYCSWPLEGGYQATDSFGQQQYAPQDWQVGANSDEFNYETHAPNQPQQDPDQPDYEGYGGRQ